MIEKFDMERHVTDDLNGRTFINAEEFTSAHGFKIRAVKQWDTDKGGWKPFLITQDYDSKRINVALNEDGITIHRVEGMG